MAVGVARKPESYVKDINSLEGLRELVHTELQARFVVALPENDKRVTLHGREWLVYSLGGQLDRIVDVTLLTPAHYLQVAFDFVDNSRGYETTWRSDAQSIADSIAASLVVRETR